MEQAKILLLDFNQTAGLGGMLRKILESSANLNVQLRQESLGVCESGSPNDNLAGIISRFNPDVIFLVLPLNPLKQANGLFQSLGTKLSEIPTIITLEGDEPNEMVELLKLGPVDFITPPLKAVDIFPRVWRLLKQTRRGEILTPMLKEKLGLERLVGKSPVFLAEIEKIPLVAPCDASILILGETGTGKELCARAVHYLSKRTSKPFISVNCGAIPVELVENELFGHERGAFTGASAARLGLLHEADSGTLFLDEIDCLPLLAQSKLLHFLQEKKYRPLGSTKMRNTDVRIIAATNVNLEAAVNEGKFRRDLYYRLNVIPLMLPPLRERRDDIPSLARYFLANYAAQFSKPVEDFSANAMQVLMLYHWPGNVRELEHVVERAVVLSKGAVIRKADIVLPCSEATLLQESFQAAKAKVIAQFESAYLQRLLLAYKGNITKAAQAAQKDRRALWQLIRKHQIDVQSFKSRTS